MAAVLPLELASDELELVQAGTAPALPIHHVLDGLAGFFRCKADAQQALQDLVQTQGLARSQVYLLGPADAPWLPWRRRARQWVRGPHAQAQPWRTDTWSVAGLGGLITGLSCAIVFPFADDLTPLVMLLVLLLAVGAGALCGKIWSDSLTLPARHRKFDSLVHRHLAGGHWVVLAHDVPWARQAAVVERVRQLSLGWCGVSSGARWK